jgi:hypothetical protein
VLDVDLENECLYGYTSLVFIQKRTDDADAPATTTAAASNTTTTSAGKANASSNSGGGDADVSIASVYDSIGKSNSCLVDNGAALRLHCRQCVIEKVSAHF